jgi:hypothetical protein
MSKVNMLLGAVAIAVLMTAIHVSAAQAQQPLQITVDAHSVWVRAGQSPVLQYRYGDVPFKPYVKELYTPGGRNVLLDAPSDHQHHHGLMFAVAVNDLNFWEETPSAGRQEQQGPIHVLIAQRGGGPSAGFTANPAWVRLYTPGRRTELYEGRTIEACQVARLRATVVTWRSELINLRPRRPATLSGSHYFGLGMRFVRAMDGGEFFNAEGKEGTVFRGEERLVQSNWCAYTASIEGKPVTVAMLGHPDNPRHPTTWFTMAKPFAYLAGTLNLHQEPLSLDAEKRLSLQYAVVVWDGKADKEQVSQAYQWFVSDYSQVPQPGEGAEQDEKQE